MDEVKQLEKLRKEVELLKTEAAVAEATKENITKQLQSNLKTLKTKFGCTTYEEASSKLASMENDLEQRILEVRSMLDALRGN